MFWNEAWKLSMSAWTNAVTLGETISASGAVISHRQGLIDAAFRDPASADVEELGRMVPEKLTAFSKAGHALLSDWAALQADMLAQMQDLTSLALGGPQPSAAALRRVGLRGSRIAHRMSKSAGRALAPIHSAATANERRLGQGSARS